MKSGFTFKGRHSDEFGLVMKTASRPILPEMKSYTYETPVMDGSYDFSQANYYGREFYRNRVFTLNMQIGADNLFELMRKISRVSVWLTGRDELIFDDMPLVKWSAAVINGIDYAPERRGKKAILSVSFDISPFSECIFDTENGPCLDSAVILDSKIPLDILSVYKMTLKSQSETVLTVINPGTWYVRPKIKIESKSGITNFKMTINDKSFMLNASGSKVVNTFYADMENSTVYTNDGENIINLFSGDFFETAPGKNEITVSADSSAYPLEFTFTFKPKLVYDFLTEDIDWGDVLNA